MLVPLFPGVPGGPELLVLLIIVVLLFGIPIVLIAGGVIAWRGTQSDDENRVEALESRVAELERELEDARGDESDDHQKGAAGRRDEEDEGRNGRDSDGNGDGAGWGPDGGGDGEGRGPDGSDDPAGDPTDGHGS